MAHAGHHLGELGPLRLVGRAVKQQCQSSRQTFAVKGAQNNPPAPGGCRKRHLPETVCFRRRQGVHETDGAAIRHHFNQHIAQRRAYVRRVHQGNYFDFRHDG